MLKDTTQTNHLLDESWWDDNFWSKVKSLNQLQSSILHHRDRLAEHGVGLVSRTRPKMAWLKPTPIISIHLSYMKFMYLMRPSAADPSLPTPGWYGRMEYTVQSYLHQLYSYPAGSEMWQGSRIRIGSGGGGYDAPSDAANQKRTQSFGYDIRIFAKDWPAMAEEYEKANTYKLLTDDRRSLNQIVNDWHPA